MKIYIINLELQVEKRRFMQAQIERLGLDAEFIPAVNGNQMPLADLRAAATDYNNSGLTPGEVGCALSHLFVYEHMLANKIEHALVLEDDAILTDNISSVLNVLSQDHSSKPLVHILTSPEVYNGSGSKPIIEGYQAHRIIKIWGAHGYVLNQHAAKSLLTHLKPIFLVADEWDFFYQMNYIDLYCIMPELVHSRDITFTDSILEAGRAEARKKRTHYHTTVVKKRRPLFVRFKRALWRLFIRPFVTKIKPVRR